MSKPEKPFKAWKARGVRYLAVKDGHAWQIMDDTGAHYGVWITTRAFRNARASDKAGEPIGVATISIFPA